MDDWPDRVLMTTDTVGGVWTYAEILVEQLADAGLEVMVASMGDRPDAQQRRAIEAIDGVELRAGDYALEWRDDPWEEVDAAGEWLLDLCRRFDPDLVHLNNYAHGDLPWRRPVLMVGHSCVLSWFRAVEGRPAPPRYETYRRRVRRGLQAADLVASPTLAMLSALDDHYGPFEHSRVLPNGVRVESFKPQSAEPFVLSAGRLWDEAKNIAALREVSAEVDWPIRVAGEPENPDGGRASLEGLDPLGRLARDDLLEWYARASVYALPARYEPFGLTPLEAALSGCALVLGDIDSLREVWGDAAIFVDPESPEQLTEALGSLIGDATHRRQMQRLARRRGRQFDAETMGRRYLDLYRDALEFADPPRTGDADRSRPRSSPPSGGV